MATAKNSALIQSAQAQAGQVGNDATWVSLWDALTNGNHLKNIQIANNPDALILDARFQIAINALVITQPIGAGESEEFAKRGVRGRITGGVWVQWHTGNPGNAGTTNVIGVARTPIAQNQFTVA